MNKKTADPQGLPDSRFPHRQPYSFLGRDVLASSDEETLLRRFDLVYSPFRTAGPGSGPLARLCFSRLGEPPADVLTMDGRTCVFDARQPESDICFFAVARVLDAVRDRVVIHGASLSDGERGTVICAPSGWGKTTLAVALGLRGLRFLSDELAPIDRATGLIAPFPRAMGLRPGTKRLLPGLGEGEGETIHPVRSIPGLRIGAPCPPGKVYFLAPPERPAPAGRKVMLAGLSGESGALLGDLRRLPGMRAAAPAAGWARPVIRLEMDEDTRVAAALERAAAAHSVGLVFAIDGDIAPPDYEAGPALRELDAAEGVRRLPRFITNRGAFLEDASLTAEGLLSELAELTAGARFYELRPGRLDAAVDLILGAR